MGKPSFLPPLRRFYALVFLFFVFVGGAFAVAGFAAAAAVLRVAGAAVVGAFLVFVVVLIFHFYSPFKIESAR
jgi:hypothetical protein